MASANHRYLVDQNGSPTLLVGDAAHSLFVNLDQAGLATYLADRKSRGFNILWVQSLCSDYLTNCRSDMSTFDGLKPFVSGTNQTNYDISTPNPDYWSRVDSYIKTAETYGITILLDTCETGALMPLARRSGNTKMGNFGIFLANRYKTVPNPPIVKPTAPGHTSALTQRPHPDSRQRWLRRSVARGELLHGASYVGKNVIGLTAHQTYGANYNYQDYRQHQSIFSDVLTLVFMPQISRDTHHGTAILFDRDVQAGLLIRGSLWTNISGLVGKSG